MDNDCLDEVPVCQATSLYDGMCTVHSRLQNDLRKRFQNSPAFVRWKKQDAEVSRIAALTSSKTAC